jgi:nucleoside-diphosphate-sugar epimerase
LLQAAGGQVFESMAYGHSKLVGERLAKSFADAAGLSVVVVRLGWVPVGDNRPADVPADCDAWSREMWLSNRDLAQVMEKAVLAPDSVRFAVVNAMSDNPGMRWDLESTRTILGYHPEDSIARR